ncbi:unnamed protein product, partial [Mesorhabditis belari]|uniref:Ig-like domain-containing protein n=1 Tax=Mesorhabditis belari TaxID=2138241 RepID=A0AAF3EEJ9_9BILA
MRKRRSTFCFLVTLIFLFILTVNGEQRIAEGPVETTVLVGATVELRCRVEDQKGAVQWTKNDFGLGIDRGLKFFPRYQMVGKATKGEYNLQIVNITVDDDDVYRCQIGEVQNERTVVSNAAKLSVLKKPTSPTQLNKPKDLTIPAIAGDLIQRSCVSKMGKPPAKIGWAISFDSEGKNIFSWLGESRSKLGHLIKNNDLSPETVAANITDNIQKDNGVFSVISNLSYVPRPDDDKKYLLCLSHHETFGEKIELDGVRLSLQYAPRVNLTVAASQQKIREGGGALLACSVDAKPIDQLKIQWFREGVLLKHQADTLAFELLKMEDHGVEYSCEAMNKIGKGKASLKLNVSFAPRIISNQQEKEVNVGEAATFTCEAHGNPKPQLYWSKAGDSQVIGKGESFTIENVQVWQQGEYICTAISDGFKQDKIANFLHIRGPPTITFDQPASVNLGDTVVFSCKVRGRPKPKEVVWSRDENDLNFNNGRMQVHQMPHIYGVESKLTIRDLQEADFGVYNCSANNGLGMDSQGIVLHKKNILDYAMQLLGNDDLLIIAAVSASVVFFCLFFLCCCAWRKRRRFQTKGSKFTASESDVTVKCEALDPPFYSEMYGGPMDDGNLLLSKDYIAVPQNNPDLDLLMPSSYALSSSNNCLYPKFMNGSTMDYNFMPSTRYDTSYGSFSGGSTPAALSGGGLSELYGGTDRLHAPLEPLPEVDTPKVSTYSFMCPERPLSRSSTHV